MASSAARSERVAVVLLSGGLDSATVLAMARAEGFVCHAMSFDYGQRHRHELAAAAAVAAALGVARHLVMPLDLRAWGGSALTSDAAVPKGRDEAAMAGGGIPVTYVPARNMVFLSLAAGYAEVVGARDLFVGVNAVDYSGYPDCRPAFIESMERTINLATKVGVEGGEEFKVQSSQFKVEAGEGEAGSAESEKRHPHPPAQSGGHLLPAELGEGGEPGTLIRLRGASGTFSQQSWEKDKAPSSAFAEPQAPSPSKLGEGVRTGHFTIRAPIISMTKGEIIRAGVALGVDYGLTHSCYDPVVRGGAVLACGLCDSCVIRRSGFVAAGVPDPTRYAGG